LIWLQLKLNSDEWQWFVSYDSLRQPSWFTARLWSLDHAYTVRLSCIIHQEGLVILDEASYCVPVRPVWMAWPVQHFYRPHESGFQRCIKDSGLKYKYEYKYSSFKYKYKYKYIVCTASKHQVCNCRCKKTLTF